MPLLPQQAVPMVIADVAFDTRRHFGFLLLREAAGSRVLPFFYSGYECLEIVELACQLDGIPFPLIPAHSLLLHLLSDGEAEFEGSEIYCVKRGGDTGAFYGTRAILRREGGLVEVDMRVSEVFHLALALHRPIWASDEVLSSQGLVYPPHLEAHFGLGQEHLLRYAPGWLGLPQSADDPYDAELARVRHEEDVAVRDVLNFALYRSEKPPKPQHATPRSWWSFWKRETPAGTSNPAQYPIPHAAVQSEPDTRPRISASQGQSVDAES